MIKTILKADRIGNAGVLIPYGRMESEQLRDAGIKVGDVLHAQIRKSRNPGFHRLAHALGQLAVENVEGFEHLTAHQAVKRLQLESDSGCEALLIDSGLGPVPYRIPKSISYGSMDEMEFRQVVYGCARHLAKRYLRTNMNELQAIIDDLLFGIEGGAA